MIKYLWIFLYSEIKQNVDSFTKGKQCFLDGKLVGGGFQLEMGVNVYQTAKKCR